MFCMMISFPTRTFSSSLRLASARARHLGAQPCDLGVVFLPREFRGEPRGDRSRSNADYRQQQLRTHCTIPIDFNHAGTSNEGHALRTPGRLRCPDDLHPGMPGMERQHVPLQGFELLRGARVRRGECPVVLATASVHDMPRHTVISGGSVRDLPIIDPRILVVGDKPLDATVQMKKVGISHLPPPSASRLGSRVPRPDFVGCNLASSRRGGAMDNQIFKLLFHLSGGLGVTLLSRSRSRPLPRL